MATNRREFVKAAMGAAAMAPMIASEAAGQEQQTQRDWSEQNPVRYPDADIVVLDKRFAKYKIGNAAIQRLYTGALWAEGPAWNGMGRYLLFSDIPSNRQMRWLDEDGHVSTFRSPSYNANGNTFDYEGRQVTCEHLTRRVVRYEHDGGVTVLTDRFQGKRCNAPNDIVVHPDGAIWFTDPGYGSMGNYEGDKAEFELKEATYRIDGKAGAVEKVDDELIKPNGICFSPDYKLAYIADSGRPESEKGAKAIQVFEVVNGRKLRNTGRAISMELPGKGAGIADGIRADVDGNLWVGSGWVGAGYDGVQIFTAGGERIGMILLPEICANICFGGRKRNRLFMAASRSVYAVYVGTQGAHIT
ncbi:MAG: SMP-30/gluconolactonase/LRE family protein [Acidobacteria bacterium]|nr:SMP-30/gluconolactonase/LRE family protein [Acidobacteriota bacterium]